MTGIGAAFLAPERLSERGFVGRLACPGAGAPRDGPSNAAQL
jgi:hypothetical protein